MKLIFVLIQGLITVLLMSGCGYKHLNIEEEPDSVPASVINQITKSMEKSKDAWNLGNFN